MWIFGWKGPSGFSASSTAEEVTQGIDGTGLTAIITGYFSFFFPVTWAIFESGIYLDFCFSCYLRLI